MTLEEAQKRKEIIGDTIIDKDIEYRVTIIPERGKDFEDFINSYLDVSDKLELAKGCSVNQEFNLCGLWTDGINILKTKVQ
ncbi:hypothetical protein MWU65_13555 [Cellulophaga sp. F20128]|uniref:hypothetical protein n=1 Tax=Cellulophaga sp. F20128 TaxID=2926413 RepID=UPI001FF42649|nr:hypothetical protein [Cellulophaga sp. F20128]MCK0158215.1 hypothetical protein [Cellulophaga sp. F20128]